MSDLPENGDVKRRRLAIPEDAFFLHFDDAGDSSDDSSYHPDKGELQEFQRESEAKVTKLIKFVRDNEVLLADFQQVLTDRIQAAQPTDHDLLATELRFAMANAIQFKKWPLLRVLFSSCPPHLLPEVFGGSYPLLNFAIKINNVEAVNVLLEHGAGGLNDFSSSSLDTIISAIEDAFDYEYFTESAAKNFLEIFRLLFEFKVDPTKCPRLMGQIASIASRSPEIASLLLENIPGHCYLPHRSCGDGKLQPSPLFSAFEAMNSWDPIEMLENSFRFGVLPMLKLGAPLTPIDDMLMPNLPPVHNLIAIEKRLGSRLWKQPFPIIRIVLEGRQTSALNIGAIKKKLPDLSADTSRNGNLLDVVEERDESSSSSNSTSDSDGDQLEECQQLFDLLRSQFPRRLQEISRTAILRRLPIGPKRISGIKSLDIPPPLIFYLLFNDLDIPPQNEQ